MRRRDLILGAGALAAYAALPKGEAAASTIITAGAASARAFGFGGHKKVNFSALNPSDKAAGVSLSNGNLTATNVSNSIANVRGTLSHNAGKWHFEVTITNKAGVNYPIFGIGDSAASLTTDMGVDSHSIEYQANGGVEFNNVTIGTVDNFTTGDVIAVEVDVPNSNFYVQKQGGSGRKGPFSFSGIGASVFIMFGTKATDDAMTLNVGARSFSITPTAGFSAWG